MGRQGARRPQSRTEAGRERLSDLLCLELVRATLGILSLHWPRAYPEVKGLHFRKRRGRSNMEGEQTWKDKSRQLSIIQEPCLWSV